MAYPPTPTLAVAAVPVIPSWTSFHNPASGGVLTSPDWDQGDLVTDTVLNEMGTRSDLVARYGGGGYGVIPGPAGTGCNLSAGSGLTLNIAAGAVMMDGTIPVSAQSVTLTDEINTPGVWIWISQAGAIVQSNDDPTPPAGAHVLLGLATTTGGSITGVDFSGVVYWLGALGGQRFTTDTATPGDTPPANISFIHHGTGKLWIWEGADYWQISSGAAAAGLGVYRVQVDGNETLVAADLLAASVIVLENDGVSGIFTVEFPAVGLTEGQIWGLRNNTGEACAISFSGGSSVLYVGDGHRATLMLEDEEILDIGRGSPRNLSSLHQVVSDPTTYTDWSQVESDLVALIPTEDSIVNWPSSLSQKGRIQAIENEDDAFYVNLRTSGTSDEEAHTYILPGAVVIGVLDQSGAWRRLPTRPMTPMMEVEMPADANFTVTHPDWLPYLLEVTSAVNLTATREFVLPAVPHSIWKVANLTGGAQIITVKTPAGSGINIANGSVAEVTTGVAGTDIRRLSSDVTY